VKELEQNFLTEHRPHFGTPYFVSIESLGPGDVATFQYKGKMRWAFVLHANWEKKMHALTLELVPRKVLETEVIDAMYETDKPDELYEQAVYKIAKDYDSYRTYLISEIKLLRRMPYFLKEKPEIRKS
jgi:hypothetical protein